LKRIFDKKKKVGSHPPGHNFVVDLMGVEDAAIPRASLLCSKTPSTFSKLKLN
jgi:hypothetical protein